MRVSAFVAPVALLLGALSAAPAFAQAAAGQAKPAQPAPAAPAPAPAQPPPPFPAGAKIAFINPQRIIQESAEGKSALTRVQTLTQKKQTENTARQKTLQENQQKLQSSGNVMSEAARSQLEKEIEKEQTDLQRFQQDAQQEIQELQNEIQAEFARRVNPIIDQLAKEKGLQLVFNAGDAGFAWVDPGIDLSPEIIKKLDASKTAAPPKP